MNFIACTLFISLWVKLYFKAACTCIWFSDYGSLICFKSAWAKCLTCLQKKCAKSVWRLTYRNQGFISLAHFLRSWSKAFFPHYTQTPQPYAWQNSIVFLLISVYWPSYSHAQELWPHTKAELSVTLFTENICTQTTSSFFFFNSSITNNFLWETVNVSPEMCF